jgi:hypothetical protein
MESNDSRLNDVMKEDFKQSIMKNLNKNGELKVNYNNRFGLGRYYADESTSIGVKSKYIKNTLFSYMGWVDLDMVKGHPTIITSLAKMNGINLDGYNKYLKHFPEICQELINYYSISGDISLTEGDIKDLFNTTIYGGSINTWIKKLNDGDLKKGKQPKKVAKKQPHELYTQFAKDTDTIKSIVVGSNKEILNLVWKDYPDKNKEYIQWKNENKVMSYFCQTIEHYILYNAYQFMIKNKMLVQNEIVSLYDGFNFKRINDIDYDLLIPKLNDYVFKKCGIKITFKLKDFPEKSILKDLITIRNFQERDNLTPVTKLVQVIDDKNNEDKDEENSNGVYNDLEATEKLYKLYPHWVFCKNELYVFNKNTGLWDSDKSSHDTIIKEYTDELYVMIKGKKDKMVVSKHKSYGNTVILRDKIHSYMKTLCRNDNWIREKQYSSLGKLLFNNGYYDSKEGKFYHKDEFGFNPEIVFFGKIHQDFLKFTDSELDYMEDIKQRLFYNPLGKIQGDYLLVNLARGLMGDIQKRILFGLGGTNCGKSIITTAIMLSCGDYVGSFNAENLAHKNNVDDEAKSMRWAMLLRYKRLIFSNEMKTKIVLNGNMIKKISSGGDTLIGRTHGKEELEFITHFLPICFANDLPNITPFDDAVDNRTKFVSFEKEFVENPNNEFELKRDSNLENEIKTDVFKRVLVGLLIQEYINFLECKVEIEPNEIKNAKSTWVGNDSDALSNILNEFEITNNSEDYVESSEIERVIKDNKLDYTLKKFGAEMKKYCIINKLDNIKNDQKKIMKRNKRVWVGIKSINENDSMEK